MTRPRQICFGLLGTTNIARVLMCSALLFSCGAFAQAGAKFPCAMDDRKCALAAGFAHVVKKPEFWRTAFAKPLEQRIGVAPPELVEFLMLDTIAQSIPSKPRAATVTPDFVADVTQALAELPPQIKTLLAPKLAGIYFIEDIGGTGFADLIGDHGPTAKAGFIVLDPTQLVKHTANAWATWKENTPFKPGAAYRLEADIETKAGDNRKNAIQYILLHELGHILSIGGNIHPSWTIAPKTVPATASFPFFELSWVFSRDRERYESRFDAAFPERKSVVYYFGAQLDARQMAQTYARLESTNFPTLYAATRPGDDFAEAFASYVHTVVMKRPWSIRIHEHGKLVRTFGSCWDQPRCADKRKILEGILALK